MAGAPALGWRAADFDLKGTDGRRYKLADVAGAKGLVAMFICNHCPYVKASIARAVADCRDLRAEGVGAVAIMPNDPVAYPDDSLPRMVEFARAHGFAFPYVIDEAQAVARAYGAVCTPEFFGFDGALALRYHGRLDAGGTRDSGAGRDKLRGEMRDAMLAVARGGPAPTDQAPSIGCSIKWRR